LYFVEVDFEQGVADVVGLREIVGVGGVCYGDASGAGGLGGGVSSMTAQRWGAMLIRSAARRNICGSGFFLVTSVPVT